jgi:hypothetical protein
VRDVAVKTTVRWVMEPAGRSSIESEVSSDGWGKDSLTFQPQLKSRRATVYLLKKEGIAGGEIVR